MLFPASWCPSFVVLAWHLQYSGDTQTVKSSPPRGGNNIRITSVGNGVLISWTVTYGYGNF